MKEQDFEQQVFIHRKGFTVVFNNIVYDERLSLKEKGLMTYLLSKPLDSWKFRISEIAKNNRDGIESIYSGLRNLRKYGYVKYCRHKDENGRFCPAYHIFMEETDNTVFWDELYNPDDIEIESSGTYQTPENALPKGLEPNQENPDPVNMNPENAEPLVKTDYSNTEFSNSFLKKEKRKKEKKEARSNSSEAIQQVNQKVYLSLPEEQDKKSDKQAKTEEELDKEFPFRNEKRIVPKVVWDDPDYFNYLFTFGKFENVYLTCYQVNKLKDMFSERVVDIVIEQMSKYQQDKKKQYTNHYSQLKHWIEVQNGKNSN
mgnify:CR=1 FL=1